MKEQSQKIAQCGMTAALCVALMMLGSFLGLGMYAAPMLAGLCLIPVGEKWGTRYQVMLWLVVGALSWMLVADVEQNLMFCGFFGWYPALRPGLEKLRPAALRWALKLAVFNAAVVALEALVVLVLVPEVLGLGMALALLALGNVTFALYDLAVPRVGLIARPILDRLFRRR